MPRFNVGDVVIPHRPSDPNRRPYWVTSMDDMDGKEFDVIEVNDVEKTVNLRHPEGRTYKFAYHWVELVEDTLPDVSPDVSGFLSGM